MTAHVSVLLCAAALAAVLAASGCNDARETAAVAAPATAEPAGARSAAPGAAPVASAASAPRSAEDALGIRVLSLTSSAAGRLWDLRYEVLDATLARPILDRKEPVALVDEDSGRSFPVPVPPKVGPMRPHTPAPVAGRIYYLLFASGGRPLTPDARLSLAVGERRIPVHLGTAGLLASD